jgi:hypothetical protein
LNSSKTNKPTHPQNPLIHKTIIELPTTTDPQTHLVASLLGLAVVSSEPFLASLWSLHSHESTKYKPQINKINQKSNPNQPKINPNHKPNLDLVSFGLDLVLLHHDFNRQPQTQTVCGMNH